MSDEVKNLETQSEEKCSCSCCNYLKKFLVVALGTFVGFYAALCLFTAFHQPYVRVKTKGHRPSVEQRHDRLKKPNAAAPMQTRQVPPNRNNQ